MKFESVTVLLPAMDETYSLEQTVEQILHTCDHRYICEIIFLMCDRTTVESRKMAETIIERHIHDVPMYIHNQVMPGVGGAIREGFDLARGSHVIMMSSDLETDPSLVRVFIGLAKRYPDRIITASRWCRGGGFEGYDKIKLVCNFIFEHVIGLFYFTRLSDLTYAYRIFPTELMKSIKWEELKHPFFLETALKPLRLGVQFIEVSAHWKARTEGVSQNRFFDNFKYFKTVFHNRFLKKSEIMRG